MQGLWQGCSKAFAQNVVGAVNVLLQPQPLFYTSGPYPHFLLLLIPSFCLIFRSYVAYRTNSVFATVELPNMNVSQVTSITLLLLINDQEAPSEVCGSGSLKTLSEQIFRKFNFYPTCIDEPKVSFTIETKPT
jgi:hypothetical protein